MTPTLEVIEPGLAVAVQDAGRPGHRALGVPLSGAADALLLACANALVGNADDAAGLEIPLSGPVLRALGAPVRVALAGAVAARRERADGAHEPLDSGHSLTLRPGEILRIGAVREGVAYLAVAGGCQVPMQLGSRSTYARARLGGIEGRAIRAGDPVPVGTPQGPAGPERRAPQPWVHADGPIRVMPGPQAEAFTEEALVTLLRETYRVGRDSDRMGLRLEGPALAHRAGADICSDGVVPGAIQVPGDGQPIVLMADAQTIGGYAKIATVIRADLPRLAHLRAGSVLRFAAVSRAEALAARAAQAEALAQWQRTIVAWRPPGQIDLEALAGANLVSGMMAAGPDRLPWE